MLIWYILHCVINVLSLSTISLPPLSHTSLFYHDDLGVIMVWLWVDSKNLLKVFVIHEAYGCIM